ncbi:MAG: rhodanese-like domain-containing protein [Ferruginibacter sp.]
MKSRYKIGILALAGFGLLIYFSKPFSERSYKIMLKSLLIHNVPELNIDEAIQQDQPLFLDAREKQEYDVSHIKNAIWIGDKTFSIGRLNGVAKNKNLIIYCSIGYRSEKITEQIIKAGYQSVSNLYGGIFEWVNEGNPVYDSTNTPTKKIHAYNHLWSKWLRKGEKIY